MFGRKRSPYRKGDEVLFTAGRIVTRGRILAVEKDGTLGIQPSGKNKVAIMVDPGRVTQAFRKGFPL